MCENLYSEENKVKRAVQYYGLQEKTAVSEINKINKSREKHYNYYTQRNWKDLNNYDIAINVDSYGTKETADILAEFVNNISKETKGVIA